MSIKVQVTIEGLCGTCSRSQVMTTRNHTIVWCRPIERRIETLVETCSQYLHKNQQDKWDFEQIAWTLKTDKSGRVMGFTAPKKEDS